MPAAKYKLKIEQGATLRVPLKWTAGGIPVDLTGYKGRMQIRPDIDSNIVIHSLTSENGGIVFSPSTGTFDLYISATDTSAFDFVSAVYDLELVAPNNDVYRVIEGEVTLSKEVTRE